MPHAENEALVRRIFAAFAEKRGFALRDAFADDATWTVPGSGTMAGTFSGREEIFGFLGRLPKETDGTYSSSLIDVLASEDRAAALYRASGTARDTGSSSIRCCCSGSRTVSSGKCSPSRATRRRSRRSGPELPSRTAPRTYEPHPGSRPPPPPPSDSITISIRRPDESTCSRASSRAPAALPAEIASRIALC